MKNKINYSFRIYGTLMLLLVSVFFITSFSQTLPYTFENNSRYTDDEIYIGLVGNYAEQGVWMEMTTSTIMVQDPSYNTLPGPEWSISPEGSNLYADMFYKLSDIPNRTIDIPLGLSGCRIFIGFKSPMYLFFHSTGGYAGANLQNPNDPNDGIRWELVELTWGEAGLWTNTSRVDAYQYPMGLEVTGYTGSPAGATYTERYYNIISSGPPNKYKKIGEILPHQTILDLWNTSVGPEFQYCKVVKTHSMDGEAIIEQPSKIPEFKPGALYGDYFNPYIDDIWETYRNKDLLIQIGDRGVWTGRVSGNRFDFTSPDGSRVATIYDKPTTTDAIEGAGQMAYTPEPAGTFKHSDDLMIQAQICAAINRHAIYTDTPDGVVQYNHDASRFFQIPDYNDYVAFYHNEAISFESQTYAFCYDDVGDHSSTIQVTYPTEVKVTIGGFANQDPQTITSVVVSPSTANLNVGENQTFTAIAYDAGGSVVPTGFTWSANAPNGVFSASTEGSFVVSASADGISGTATVNVSNQNNPPVADAGLDLTIDLPVNTVTLNGTISYDPDGDAINYAWTQISGPSIATITGPASATPVASNLIEGVYEFQLTVSDGLLSGNDEVYVSVLPSCAIANIALGQPASSSSVEGAYVASNAVDGIMGTRSSTLFTIPQWLKVDLGSSYSIDAVTLIWERACAESYLIMVSDVNSVPDPASADWTIISTQTGLADAARTDNLTGLSGSGRYIAMYATNKLHPWGISLYEFEVYPSCGETGNNAPIAIVGNDQTITLPTNSVSLDGTGSYDPDGDAITYAWSQLSGPSAATISGASSATAMASNLIEGTYVFELTVDDYELSGSDQVIITVLPESIAPVANAGSDQIITLPTNSVSLDGTNSSDANGDPLTYAWTQVSGPSSATISSATSATATASNLVEGVYVFELTVDDGVFSDADQVTITVLTEPNLPPIVNAGADQSITLPANSVSLDGTGSYDPDGDAISYAWSQVSGPSVAAIIGASSATATASNLIEGTYEFELAVSDAEFTETDQVTITVISTCITSNIALGQPASSSSVEGAYVASNAVDGILGTRSSTLFTIPQWLKVDLGTSYSIDAVTLIWERACAESYLIMVSDVDSDPNPASADWTIISTQTGLADAARTDNLTGLSGSGRYIAMYATNKLHPWGISLYEFEVYPSCGEPVNNAPIAIAGNDQTITLPTNCVTLDGSGSYDPDGDAISHTWSQISGPSTATISGASNATATACNLVEGTYVFELTVVDGSLSSSDQVTIIVYPEPVNTAPTAVAGTDQTITLPTNSVSLDGTASYDLNGDAITYVWSQVSGPSTATISSATSATATASNLVEGTYVFELTVNDGDLSDSDQVTVIVNPIPAGCIVSAVNGDFSVEVTNDGANPSLTFIPGYAGVGDNIVILYYKVGNTGAFPGYIVQPNVPYQINANAGDHVYLYYTYSLPAGGERNSAANKNDFIVGQCGSTLKESTINTSSSVADVEVYPNPASNVITISLNESSYHMLSVFNITGQKVLEQEITSENTSLNISHLSEGAYFFHFTGTNDLIMKKIIVK